METDSFGEKLADAYQFDLRLNITHICGYVKGVHFTPITGLFLFT